MRADFVTTDFTGRCNADNDRLLSVMTRPDRPNLNLKGSTQMARTTGGQNNMGQNNRQQNTTAQGRQGAQAQQQGSQQPFR